MRTEQLSERERDCFVCLVSMNSTVRPLKGQTICAANVRLREGKHGLVEEGQGETKAQVKDVPVLSYHPIILAKKNK